MKKAIEDGEEVFLSIIKGEAETSVPLEATPILEGFNSVLRDETPSLPPKRKVDHAVDLEPGGKVPNLPTCRKIHKVHEELFKQLEEHMSKGFI